MTGRDVAADRHGSASAFADRIASLAAQAAATRDRFDPSELDGKDGEETELAGSSVTDHEEAALVAARDGLGPVVGLYVEARTAADPVRFSATEMQRLHAATNDWLAVYARCHGVEADPDVTVREAAEALVATHDITDVAALLTGLHRR
ncbi:hypothetical protein [Halorubrum vacuolatum]|uniref:DUF8055 domain-containing protein n=1 Tax=Halorubrum vacuolatum TaxID=63740 RepID=A0A238X1I3_HALVU|nr:hypothetical protein [Halorubrum vacuolatum]SNR52294.1 hypothetical protein SAMN06264855_11218 [Halorubrum vacuolatum]